MSAASIATAAYLVAAILFILSLHGLSKHETARSGVVYGIAGMAIALVATTWLTAEGAFDPSAGSGTGSDGSDQQTSSNPDEDVVDAEVVDDEDEKK